MEVRNPRYANADKTLIDVEILHPVFGWIPFTASPEDVEAHGRELFAMLAAGEGGTVADYVPPPEPVKPVQEQEAQAIEGEAAA